MNCNKRGDERKKTGKSWGNPFKMDEGNEKSSPLSRGY